MSAGSRRIAVVGAGPAGLYCLPPLLADDRVEAVDVFDALPAPYGLVRYGVAADHAKTKRVAKVLARELERDQVRFFGNVVLGRDVHLADLRQHYDAVVVATGASHDRRLDVPGADLPGSHGAAEFVAWYSGHPDAGAEISLQRGSSAVVIGAGNVALDVTRILAKTSDELAVTDMPDDVIGQLAASTVTDVHVVIRRGPADVKFSAPELRELGRLENATVVIDPDDLDLDPRSVAATETSREAATAVKVFRGWLEEAAARPGLPRRVHLHFWCTPQRLLGESEVTGVEVSRRRPPADGSEIVPETSVIPASLVLRAIGYQPDALPEVPFDPDRCIVPNDLGRVLTTTDGERVSGLYVSGWVKRGPTGVIGTNRSDAMETSTALLQDLSDLPARPVEDAAGIVALLLARGVQVVDWGGWLRLEQHEASLGVPRGAESVKVARREAMLAATREVEEAEALAVETAEAGRTTT
ncbi:FAD-dependent oxidoreductase [Jatrophihabitans sp. YIM 134969]